MAGYINLAYSASSSPSPCFHIFENTYTTLARFRAIFCLFIFLEGAEGKYMHPSPHILPSKYLHIIQQHKNPRTLQCSIFVPFFLIVGGGGQ